MAGRGSGARDPGSASCSLPVEVRRNHDSFRVSHPEAEPEMTVSAGAGLAGGAAAALLGAGAATGSVSTPAAIGHIGQQLAFTGAGHTAEDVAAGIFLVLSGLVLTGFARRRRSI